MAIIGCADVTLLMVFAILVGNEVRRVPSERVFWIGIVLFLVALTGMALSYGDHALERMTHTASALTALFALATLVRNELRRVPSEKRFWVNAGLFFAALAVWGVAT
jgi:hypothetical protein